MKSLWTNSTFVLVSQFVLAGIFYFATRSLDQSLVGAIVAAFALTIFATNLPFLMVAGGALGATVLLTMLTIPETWAGSSPSFLAALVVLALSLVLPLLAARARKGGPFWARYIAAMPLGIGTVIGGALVLAYQETFELS